MSLELPSTPSASSTQPASEIFCTKCGAKNLAGNTFCHSCGNKIWTANAPTEMTLLAEQAISISPPPRANLQTRMAEPHQFNYLEAIIFPFKQKNWVARMWWLPLITFIPPFSFIIMRGWRLDLVRRIGKRNPDPLPSLNDIGRFFAEGILLYVMTAIYLIPLAVFTFVAGRSWIQTVLEIGFWLLQLIFDRNNAVSLGSFITQLGFGAIIQLASPFVYLVLTYPFYRMSMIRYALGKNAMVFFDVVGNAREIWRNPIMLMSLWFLEILTAMLFGVINGFIAGTLIGLPFVLAILFPLQYSVTGYLFGTLAERVNPVPVTI